MNLSPEIFNRGFARNSGRIVFCIAIGLAQICYGVDDLDGGRIYAAKCASCHGVSGEGVADEFDDPLEGDLSLEELTGLIESTMPDEDPDCCVGKEATDVARFVFDSFYSLDARNRNNAPRIELSRLTVRQYRESIADLLGTFGRPFKIQNSRGLKAEYFASRNKTDSRRLAKQVDATIDFADIVPHFDASGEYKSLKPEDEEKKANNMNDGFSVYWTGGLIAPDTGTYEIVVESKNGFQLWLNDFRQPLIDRQVRSDEIVEHGASVYLLGGRIYSLKLQMFSYPDPPPQIRLMWKPPGERLAVIPERALSPGSASPVAIVSTAFPADDASAGYARGVSVSRQWDAATTEAAIDVANLVASRINGLAKTERSNDISDDDMEKIRSWCHQFVRRAFVTELSDEDRRFYVDQHFELDLPVQDQIKRVVILTLKSPRFLYPELEQRDREHELIRRMALCLWDSIPDMELLETVDRGELSDEAVSKQLGRMVEDPRSKQKLRTFFQIWLEAEKLREATKDNVRFPDFNDRIAADLRTSLELFLDEVVWSKPSDFRQLFLADYLFVNPRLATFYGIDDSQISDTEPETFLKVGVDPEQRAGVLTHPALMTGLAYHSESSPIHRGVFVARRVLGRQLRQPPENVEPLTEEFDPTMTVRQRVEHQTGDTACMNCHTVINPLGFSLENFDAVGRFRTEEKDRPIEVAAIYNTPEGDQIELEGARDLAVFLAHSPQAQRTFIRQLFRHYAKQPVEAYGERTLDELHQSFVEHDFSIQRLMIDIARMIINHEMENQP